MTDRRTRPEWPQLLNYGNFRLSGDPTNDLRTWCDWRVDLNNIICNEDGGSKTQDFKELIKKTNKRKKRYLFLQEPRKQRSPVNQFLLVNFGLPRVTKLRVFTETKQLHWQHEN